MIQIVLGPNCNHIENQRSGSRSESACLSRKIMKRMEMDKELSFNQIFPDL